MKIDYNNLGIGVIAIGAILNNCTSLSVAKTTLILPLVTHTECLYHLARTTTRVQSVEKLIAEKTSFFSNYNARYYDALTLSFNSIQYLIEMDYALHNQGLLIKSKSLEYDSKMGARARKIFQASKNISELLSASDKTLFLNLRVQL